MPRPSGNGNEVGLLSPNSKRIWLSRWPPTGMTPRAENFIGKKESLPFIGQPRTLQPCLASPTLVLGPPPFAPYSKVECSRAQSELPKCRGFLRRGKNKPIEFCRYGCRPNGPHIYAFWLPRG